MSKHPNGVWEVNSQPPKGGGFGGEVRSAG